MSSADSKPLARFQVWFVTGSQDLYGEDALRAGEEHAGEVAAALEASAEIPVRVVAKGVVKNSDGIRRVVLDANAADECAGLVTWMHTFSPSKMWIAGLERLQKPMLHLHTQFNRSLPWAEIDMDFMNLNQSAHGDREFGFIGARLGVVRKVVAGHWGDEAVQRRIGTWSRAAAGWAEAQTLKVVRFGDNMREVAVTEGDKVEAQKRLGIAVNTWGVNDLAARVEGSPQGTVDDLLAACLDAYDVAPELAPGGERHGSLVDAVRIEAGIRAFLDEHGAKAFTTTFEDLGALKQLPGLGPQRLMADGYGFAGEGDWKTAALLRIMKVMAEGLPEGTAFMEDYTYHFGPGEPLLLGSHMLEVDPSIAAGRPRLEVHPLGIGDREDPVRLVFDAAPGPAINVGVLQLGNRFRFLLNEIDVVTPHEPLPRLPVARALWRPQPDLATSAEDWLLAGGPHHTVYSAALGTEAMVDFTEMARSELVRIDAATDLWRLKQDLRANAVYYG
jgi:L-arabinose isomerase